jgi:hypothetical protein
MRSGIKNKSGESTKISRYVENKWSEPVDITEKLQHPANLVVLSDNRIILTYSDRNIENQRILLKISRDNGKSWSNEIQIGRSFRNCDFGYPSTIELTGGILETVFYAVPSNNPYFYFNNPDLYDNKLAKGYYYQYTLYDMPVLD